MSQMLNFKHYKQEPFYRFALQHGRSSSEICVQVECIQLVVVHFVHGRLNCFQYQHRRRHIVNHYVQLSDNKKHQSGIKRDNSTPIQNKCKTTSLLDSSAQFQDLIKTCRSIYDTVFLFLLSLFLRKT